MLAGPKLAAHFKPSVSAGQALAAYRRAEGKAARLATQPAGSVPNTTMQHWLWEVGKTEKADVEIVPMGIDATQQALLTGAVDGATVREPAVTIVTQRDPRIKIVALGGEMFPNQPGTVVALTGAIVQNDPKTAQSIVDMTVRAVNLIKSSPDRVAPHIEAVLGKGIVDTATIRAALTSPASKFVADPNSIVEATRLMQAYQVKLGSLDKEYPLEGLFDPSFYSKAKRADVRIGKSLALGAAGLTSFLVLWEGIVQAGFVSQAFLPAPSQIPAALLREIRSGFWISSIYASLGHYLAGLAVGSILGIGLGVVTGLSHPSEAFLAWVVRLLRPIPGLAWVPFAIIWFGVSTPAAPSSSSPSGVFWICYFATLGAVRAVDRDLIEVADALASGRRSPSW